MKLNRQARFALILVAAALLVAGLAGPVRRAAESRDKARAADEMRQQLERERVTRAEEYVGQRERVLADARAAIDRSDYAAALKIVSPYASVPDEALRELFREAAGAESMRQRRETMVALVTRDCNEANVRAQVAAMLEKAVEPGVTGEPPRTAVRLTGVEAREVVLTRLREPPHPELDTVPGTMPVPIDWVTRMRRENRGRPLPDYLGMVYSPMAQDVMCVWRVDGRRFQDVRTFGFAIDVWMAPTPDGKALAADPVRYVERPL